MITGPSSTNTSADDAWPDARLAALGPPALRNKHGLVEVDEQLRLLSALPGGRAEGGEWLRPVPELLAAASESALREAFALPNGSSTFGEQTSNSSSEVRKRLAPREEAP